MCKDCVTVYTQHHVYYHDTDQTNTHTPTHTHLLSSPYSYMKLVFNLQNATGGVHQDCVKDQAAGDAWRCMFANYSYAYSKTPFFPLQSALDSWQMGNDLRDSSQCVKTKFSTCTASEITTLNRYASDLMRDFRRTAKFSRKGEGGFVESCLEHVGAQSSKRFDTYTINGTTEKDALTKWWQSDGTEPAATHWYLPCELNAAAPHQCNPSC